MEICKKCKNKNIKIKIYKRHDNVIEKTYTCNKCFYTEQEILSNYDYKTRKRTVINYIKNILWFFFVIVFMYTAHATQKAITDKKFVIKKQEVICIDNKPYLKWEGYYLKGLRKFNNTCEGIKNGSKL